MVVFAVPPLSTTWEPVNIVPPLAKPKSSCVPPEISAPLSVPPPLTISLPPLKIVVGSAKPPERTASVPPLETVVLDTVPLKAASTMTPPPKA